MTSESGIVIPSLVLSNGTDGRRGPVPASRHVGLPGDERPGLVPTLVLSKTGSIGATVAIDLFTPVDRFSTRTGGCVAARTCSHQPRRPGRTPFAVRIRSNVPVSAVIQAGPGRDVPIDRRCIPEDVSSTATDEEPPIRGILRAKSRRRRRPSPKTALRNPKG